MKNITVIGTGYVGLITGLALAEIGNNVTCIDIDTEKIELLNKGIPTLYEDGLEKLLNKNLENKRIIFSSNYDSIKNSDFVFITVGTPEKDNGEADLSFVNNVVDNIINNVEKDIIVVMKSTVPIGTNDIIEKKMKKEILNYKVDVISNPEFLSQGTAINDTFNASRIVLGINNENIIDTVKNLYKAFNQPILVMNRTSAEMVKYSSNTFLATKISFINEIANLCTELGADIRDVKKGMSYDERIGDKFLNAGLGYGGSCFPKDTKALVKVAENSGAKLQIIEAGIRVNEQQKYTQIEYAMKKGFIKKGAKVAVLGLTFKPNTDDIREAPSIYGIERLISEGVEVNVYDPLVNDKVKKIFGNRIKYFNSPISALKDTECCFIYTEWNTIQALKAIDFIENMSKPIIFDGRNCINLNEESKIHYYGIGISN